VSHDYWTDSQIIMFDNNKSQILSLGDLMTDMDVIVVGTQKFGAIFRTFRAVG